MVVIFFTSVTGRQLAAAPLDQLPAHKRIAFVNISEGISDELDAQFLMGISRLAEEYSGTIRGDTKEITFGSSFEFRKVSTGNDRADITDNLRQLAEEGYGLIVGLGFRFVKSINPHS